MFKAFPKGQAPEPLESLAALYRSADASVVVNGEYKHIIPPVIGVIPNGHPLREDSEFINSVTGKEPNDANRMRSCCLKSLMGTTDANLTHSLGQAWYSLSSRLFMDAPSR